MVERWLRLIHFTRQLQHGSGLTTVPNTSTATMSAMEFVSRLSRAITLPATFRCLALTPHSPFSNTKSHIRHSYPHTIASRCPSRSSSTMAENAPHSTGRVYVQDPDLEELEDYSVGGFHPIIIGDVLNDGRYEIAHKLGFGGYSTTWLARDRVAQRYVAVKVPVADKASTSSKPIFSVCCQPQSQPTKDNALSLLYLMNLPLTDRTAVTFVWRKKQRFVISQGLRRIPQILCSRPKR